MSTEIIAQIDFPTPFATLPLRFKCPAMCCSQTARTPRLRNFPPGQPALPEIITQLAFLSSGGPRRRGRTDVVQLSPHLIYIICASFCLPWPATQLSTCVHLALLVAHCPSVCLSAGRLVGWSTPPRPPFQLTQDYGHVLAAAVVVIQPLNCVLAFVAFSTAFLWLLQLRFSSWVSNNIIGIEGFSQPAQRPSSLNLG